MIRDLLDDRSVPGVAVDIHGQAVHQIAGNAGEHYARAGDKKSGKNRRNGNKNADQRMYAAYNQFN